jgi:CRP/FNR family transcriptional regulator
MDNLEIFLSKLFPNKELVKTLEDQASVMEIPNNVMVLHNNEYVKVIPLVIEGRIKVMRNDESGKEVLLYYINPGESCALSISAGLNNQKSIAYAVTDKNTRLLAIPVSKLDSLIKQFPYLNKFVLELFNKRFNELIEFIDAISFKSIDSRLLEYLKKNISLENDVKYVFTTHKHIAEELGTAREVISRLLKQLEKQGIIKNHRAKIEILIAL